MTERKPRGVSIETWVDKQIREAEARGDFEHLPSAGKPIPGQGQPDDELWWLKGYMAREKLDFALPPALKLRKEIEDLPATVDRERQEHRVRQRVTDLNERIARENRWPSPGPPLNRMPVDVEAVVAGWTERRAARFAAAGSAAGSEPAGTDPTPPRERRSGWWRRGRRSRAG